MQIPPEVTTISEGVLEDAEMRSSNERIHIYSDLQSSLAGIPIIGVRTLSVTSILQVGPAGRDY